MAVVAIVVHTAHSRAATPFGSNGDVDHDGRTTALDAVLVLQHDAGLLQLDGISGDVDFNGAANSLDALVMLQNVAELGSAQLIPSSLRKIDLVLGSGQTVQPNETVTVNYQGWLTDGTLFDSSTGPARFPLTGVIAGWQRGIPGMRVGGKRRLVIPPDLAYGHQGSGDTIPPDATLVFDIELVSIP